MFTTLLSSTLFSVTNPHKLVLGAHNEEQDEDMGGLIEAERLPSRHNALNFREPTEPQSFSGNFSLEDTVCESNANFFAAGSCNDSFLNSPAFNTQSKQQLPQRSCLLSNDENNKPFKLPVFCGFDEEELLPEQYKK